MQKKSDKLGNVSTRFRRGFGEVTATLLFLKFKLNVNSNENESKNASGGACARGAKRPRVGVLTRCVFVFVFVLIYVEFEFSESTRSGFMNTNVGLALRFDKFPRVFRRNAEAIDSRSHRFRRSIMLSCRMTSKSPSLPAFHKPSSATSINAIPLPPRVPP